MIEGYDSEPPAGLQTMEASDRTLRQAGDVCDHYGMSNAFPLIASDPSIHHGQACIRGTRVAVSVVLDCLAEGMGVQDIVAEYPTLTPAGIQAALEYAAALAREENVVLAPAVA
jgi:uncharacterized protein (DUF433 family)